MAATGNAPVIQMVAAPRYPAVLPGPSAAPAQRAQTPQHDSSRNRTGMRQSSVQRLMVMAKANPEFASPMASFRNMLILVVCVVVGVSIAVVWLLRRATDDDKWVRNETIILRRGPVGSITLDLVEEDNITPHPTVFETVGRRKAGRDPGGTPAADLSTTKEGSSTRSTVVRTTRRRWRKDTPEETDS
ncbi:uncharacterized protein LOC135372619 [Ornithodoros turicata]|uniref:uncharacterized protein LOC135372619 n=1 Tax=Ornithodoros turicata TaxID=34597 RepID=UPI0031390B0F